MAALQGWGRQTWSSGAFGQIAPVAITGVSSTGSVGSSTVTAIENAIVNVTGSAATGSVGTVTQVSQGAVNVTGVVGTFSVSAPVFDITVPLGGWSRDAWGAGPWSESGSDLIITGTVGNVTVDGIRNESISVTGLSIVSAIGTAASAAEAQASVTGVSLSTAIGTAASAAQAQVSVTGTAITASIGSLVIDVSVTVSGVEATGETGSISQTNSSNVNVTGVFGTGSVNNVNIWGILKPNQDPDWVKIVA